MKSQEDEFYLELDRKSLHRSCCTFQTMLIFFVILIVVVIIGTIYCYRQIKQFNLPSKIVATTFYDKNSFEQKLKQIGQDQNFELTVTQEELTSVVSDGISGKNFIIKNIQVIITPSGMDIYGTLTKPLNSQLKISNKVVTENGKVKLEVEKIVAGSLTVPKMFYTDIAESLNKALDQKFQVLYDQYQVENVETLDGKMIIRGKLK